MKRVAALAPAALLLGSVAFLAGCGDGNDLPEARSTTKAKATQDDDAVAPVTAGIGTPMAERVAVIGFLNKRNGKSQDYELKPGESVRVGNQAIIRVRACEKTAPWESFQDSGAFVQLFVNAKRSGQSGPDRFEPTFSGWLFKNHPAANVVENELYDVWIKDCRMSFPGEEEALGGVTTGTPSGANRTSSADQSPTVIEETPAEDTVPAPAPEEPDTTA